MPQASSSFCSSFTTSCSITRSERRDSHSYHPYRSSDHRPLHRPPRSPIDDLPSFNFRTQNSQAKILKDNRSAPTSSSHRSSPREESTHVDRKGDHHRKESSRTVGSWAKSDSERRPWEFLGQSDRVVETSKRLSDLTLSGGQKRSGPSLPEISILPPSSPPPSQTSLSPSLTWADKAVLSVFKPEEQAYLVRIHEEYSERERKRKIEMKWEE